MIPVETTKSSGSIAANYIEANEKLNEIYTSSIDSLLDDSGQSNLIVEPADLIKHNEKPKA